MSLKPCNASLRGGSRQRAREKTIIKENFRSSGVKPHCVREPLSLSSSTALAGLLQSLSSEA